MRDRTKFRLRARFSVKSHQESDHGGQPPGPQERWNSIEQTRSLWWSPLGVVHLSRVARPLRAAEKRNKSSKKKKKDEYDKTEKKGKIQMNKKRLGACWSEVLLTFFFYDPFFGHKLNKPLTRKVGGR